MPRGDGTGPAGFGSMSGNGAGFRMGAMNTESGFASCRNNGAVARQRCRNTFNGSGLPGWMQYGYSESAEINQEECLKKHAEFLEEQLVQIKECILKLNADK